MSRINIILSAAIAVLAAGLAISFATRPAPGLGEPDVRAIVSAMLSDRQTAQPQEATTTAELDPKAIEPVIESYLLDNPSLLERMSDKLQAERNAEQAAEAKAAIASMHDQIFNDPGQVVVGNPNGDVTLVEMFDYNCTYCRGALPDMAELLQSDPNLRVVLKEFPILSQDSADAAHIAIAAYKQGVDYWQFHTSLFTSRGRVTEQTAIDAAKAQGLDPVKLQLQAADQEVDDIIKRSYEIASAIGTTGTPTYIIGDEVIPGAIGIDALRQRIDNMRKCGSTVCDG